MSSTGETLAFSSASEQETRELGKKIGSAAPSGSVVSLRGPLGAGKTVIAKGVAEALPVD